MTTLHPVPVAGLAIVAAARAVLLAQLVNDPS